MQVHWRLQLGDLAAAEAGLKRVDEIEARHPDAQGSALGEIAVVAERARIRWAFARGQLDEAGTRIDALIACIEVRGRQRLVAQLRLIQAAIELRRGRREAARDCALAALRRGHRLGPVRSLLDADPAALELVREIGRDPSLDPVLAFLYVERLTRGAGAAEGVAPEEHLRQAGCLGAGRGGSLDARHPMTVIGKAFALFVRAASRMHGSSIKDLEIHHERDTSGSQVPIPPCGGPCQS